jgi:hypothetical protein
MYNLILLNHFYGYPDLIDKSTNDIRYAQLLRLIHKFNPMNTIFFCSNDWRQDKRLESISEIAKSEGFTWVEYEEDENIENILNKKDLEITPSNSTVIIGGTNTAGCLLRNSNVAAINWINLGFNVQICLSMCADYQLDGVNSTEKNSMAMGILYQFVKSNNVINKLDIFYDVTELRRKKWKNYIEKSKQ